MNGSGLDFSVVFQILSVAALSGIGWARIKACEKALEDINRKHTEYQDLKTDIEVIKTRLENLAEIMKHVYKMDLHK